MLSTGKICEDIAAVAASRGWDCHIAYGRNSRPGISKVIRAGSVFNTIEHYFESKVFDREGLASRRFTLGLIKEIRSICPDIIHLHNIHDHYLNYEILFNYLAESNIPVVWTQHDCWSFTGGCMYFDMLGCCGWENTECSKCPDRRSLFVASASNYHKKQASFMRIPKLVMVPVSDWLHGLLDRSMHKGRHIITLHNGVDLQRFHPYKEDTENSERTRFLVLGVAAKWDARKGLEDFIKLRSLLSDDYEFTLVGLSKAQIKRLPNGIRGITRTHCVDEMARLYSSADVFVNPTYSDNFPSVNLEALACGTPVVTYDTGGSPEAVDNATGAVIPCGDIEALAASIIKMRSEPSKAQACRSRAEEYFDKDKCFAAYLDIYNSLLP